MHSDPQIAVVIPTFNRADLLVETLASVRAQTFRSWECVVVDDGSSDQTASVVQDLAKVDSRFRYLARTGPSNGANLCRNQGFAASTAPLLIFLDSDDLLEPTCLDYRFRLMNRNLDLDFAVFQGSVFREKPNDLGRGFNDEYWGDDLLRFLFLDYPWQTTGPIWRRAALLRVGLFDEQLPSWQDIDLHLRAIACGLYYLRTRILDYHVRWHSDANKVSVQQRRSPRHLVIALTILEKFEAVVRTQVGMDWVRQRALCGLYFFVSELWIEQRNLTRALGTWSLIRQKEIGDWFFWASGALILILLFLTDKASIFLRLSGKWKGWMRLRANPSLLSQPPQSP